MGNEITTTDFINFTQTVNESLLKQTDLIVSQNKAIGRLEGKLDDGISKDIQDLKNFREIDKNEAIENRNKDRELIMLAIKNQIKSCPNTFSLRSLSRKLKSHIKKHKNEKSNKKGWLKFIIPTIISAGALIVAIVIKI